MSISNQYNDILKKAEAEQSEAIEKRRNEEKIIAERLERIRNSLNSDKEFFQTQNLKISDLDVDKMSLSSEVFCIQITAKKNSIELIGYDPRRVSVAVTNIASEEVSGVPAMEKTIADWIFKYNNDDVPQ